MSQKISIICSIFFSIMVGKECHIIENNKVFSTQKKTFITMDKKASFKKRRNKKKELIVQAGEEKDVFVIKKNDSDTPSQIDLLLNDAYTHNEISIKKSKKQAAAIFCMIEDLLKKNDMWEISARLCAREKETLSEYVIAISDEQNTVYCNTFFKKNGMPIPYIYNAFGHDYGVIAIGQLLYVVYKKDDFVDMQANKYSCLVAFPVMDASFVSRFILEKNIEYIQQKGFDAFYSLYNHTPQDLCYHFGNSVVVCVDKKYAENDTVLYAKELEYLASMGISLSLLKKICQENCFYKDDIKDSFGFVRSCCVSSVKDAKNNEYKLIAMTLNTPTTESISDYMYSVMKKSLDGKNKKLFFKFNPNNKIDI